MLYTFSLAKMNAIYIFFSKYNKNARYKQIQKHESYYEGKTRALLFLL